MAKYTLTVLDTAGIQNYIFGSNVLRENIGASDLVWRATHLWPLELVRSAGTSNVKPGELTGTMNDLLDERHIEDPDIAAEVVYAGGGKCLILFKERPAAEKFATDLSAMLMTEAPDLNLVVAHGDVSWDQPRAVVEQEQAALGQLAAKKLRRPVSAPLLGVGTTVACQSTGLPAVGTDADEPKLKPEDSPVRPLSAGILAKLRQVEKANKRLEKYLPQFRQFGLTIPHELDNFGRSEGEMSYIAVVHADGNKFGSRIRQIQEDTGSLDNRAYVQARRDFSRAVETAASTAFKELSTRLLRHTHLVERQVIGQAHDARGKLKPVEDSIALSEGEKGEIFIPFRPLVFGGDDVTFVTDGRLGLELASAYLQAFETALAAQNNPHTRSLQAAAGVAVVKTHYPFARAYDLAEDLCHNAKQAWDRECSAIDWHFAAAGIFGDIETIRERQYTTPAGRLEMRPLPLTPQSNDWRSWEGFTRITKAFLLHQEWQDRRNKVIDLREALRKGPEAVEQFRRAYKVVNLPLLATGVAALQETGWSAGRCGYFDAIEALDFYTPLEG